MPTVMFTDDEIEAFQNLYLARPKVDWAAYELAKRKILAVRLPDKGAVITPVKPCAGETAASKGLRP